MENNKNKTVVECYLTGCKYNSACCISPADTNKKCYCTRNYISIDLDEESMDFQCKHFESGLKKYKCVNCLMKENDGEIPLFEEDIFEVELFDNDDDILK